MVFIPKPEKEKEEELQAGQEPATGGAVTRTAAPTTGGGGPGLAGGGIQTGVGPREAGLVNFQRFLEANRPQTQRLAQRLSSGVQRQQQRARGGLETGRTQFRQQVEEATLRPDQEFVSGALSTPVTFSQDPQGLERFQRLRGGQFQGPSRLGELESFGDIAGGISSAQRATEATASPEGRRRLLLQLAAQTGRGIGAGSLALDQALLRGDPASQAIFQQVRRAGADLPGALTGAQAQAQEFAQQAAETSRLTGEDITAQTEAARQVALGRISERVASEREAALGLSTSTQEALAAGQALTPEQIEVLGLTPEQASEFTRQTTARNRLEELLGAQELQGGALGAFLDPRLLEAAAADPGLFDPGRGLQGQLTLQDGLLGRDISQDIINQQAFAFDPLAGLTQLSPEALITQQTVATPEDIAQLEALRGLGGQADLTPEFLTDPSLLGTSSRDLLDFQAAPLLEQLGLITGGQTSQDLINRAQAQSQVLQQQRDILGAGGFDFSSGEAQRLFSQGLLGDITGTQRGFNPLTDVQRQSLEQAIAQREQLLQPLGALAAGGSNTFGGL